MTIRQWHLTRGDNVDGSGGTLTAQKPVMTSAEPVVEAPAGRSGARRLGVIGLALVLIAAMDSIRNLPTTATFGWSAIFFYVIAVVTYLVRWPCARPSWPRPSAAVCTGGSGRRSVHAGASWPCGATGRRTSCGSPPCWCSWPRRPRT